jgi:hypothetical protein
MSALVISTAAVTLPPTLSTSAPSATTIAGDGNQPLSFITMSPSLVG